MLVIDTMTGQIMDTKAIATLLKKAHPYRKWLREEATRIRDDERLEETLAAQACRGEPLKALQRMYHITNEDRTEISRPNTENGQYPIGSMGDDTPMAVLSQQIRHVGDFFRQQLAQVTNPPLDPLRESIVMSLQTCLGAATNIFNPTPRYAHRIILSSPVLSASKMQQCEALDDPAFISPLIAINYEES